jgi:hypothetical protein
VRLERTLKWSTFNHNFFLSHNLLSSFASGGVQTLDPRITSGVFDTFLPGLSQN